ncbi:MAG: hypothetical protein WDZ49_07940 [Litorilinea sp.]
MALTEIEFDLPAQQFELLGYPALQQGQVLTVVLESSVLLPDPASENWFTVQPERLSPRLVHVGHSQYAFSGPIISADLMNDDGVDSAALQVRCDDVPVRILCAPQADGRLPYGTWETRTISGVARLYGVAEEDYSVGVGESIDVTLWHFRRLVLQPGDALFGQWHATDALPPTPFGFDRIVVTAHIHRNII